MEFASLPLNNFKKSDFAEYLAFSAHFANCEECRKIKNEMVSFVEKYKSLIASFDEDALAQGLQEFLDAGDSYEKMSQKYPDFEPFAGANGGQKCAIEDVSADIVRGGEFGSETTPELEFLDFMTEDDFK